MTAPRRIRTRMTAPRAWFGSALILFGGALNMMGFVMLGTIDQEPMPSALSIAWPADAHPETAAPSVPSAIVLASHGPNHHAVAARTMPDPGTTSLHPTAGELTAGHQSGDPASTLPPTQVADMPPATHISIAAVGIDTGIVEVTSVKTQLDGRTVFTWSVADWAAGHHDTSADPGEEGNIILSGHDDVRGEVFRGLHDISLGDQVLLTSPAGVFTYAVTEIHVREYRDAAPEELVAAGEFLAPMPEERVTLVTCWPYGINTHRMIVVAKPMDAR